MLPFSPNSIPAFASALMRAFYSGHPTTRNWPLIALHHYGMEAKSTGPSPHGLRCGFTGLAALTAAAKLAPLSFYSRPSPEASRLMAWL